MRQFGVGHFTKQWLLPFFDDALAFRDVDQRGLDKHWRRVMFFDVDALVNEYVFSLAGGLFTNRQIFRNFALFAARLHQTGQPQPQPLRGAAPGKPKHAGCRHHAEGNQHQTRARKTQPFHTETAHQKPKCAAGMVGQIAFITVKPRPLQPAAGDQQHRQTQPKNGAAPRHSSTHIAAQPAGQARQPRAHTRGNEPPRREPKEEIAPVSQISAQRPAPIAKGGRACCLRYSRSGPRRVLG